MSRLPPSFAKHLKPLRQPVTRPSPAAAKNGIQEALLRAREYFGRGEIGQAEKVCVAILAREPDNAQALVLSGLIARGAGDLGLALTYFKKAVDLQPKSVEARLQLAATYGEAREHQNAIKHFRQVLSLKPDLVAALGALGKSYTDLGDAASALPFFESAIKLQPNHPSLRYDYAEALIALGRMDDAAKLLRESIARGFRVASAYRSLADTQHFSCEPAELATILARTKSVKNTGQEAMDLHHAAGKILNDLGRYEDAVDQFQQSKLASGPDYDIEAFRRTVSRLIASFTPDLLKSKAGFGDRSEVPVFIVGMPRSGTTLTEQICASHPAVHGAGELAKLGILLQSAGYTYRSRTQQKPVQGLTSTEASSIAAEYLSFVRRLSPSSTRIVDKMPQNFLHIGMISLLLPEARIIHCTRDPIDNCISCFFNTFNLQLRTLGLYYREYKRLMDHWNTLLPGKIYECNYETMIADQERESRRLINFLGLPWDDACLRFHETERSVTTPSRWQVRQPIYASSVKRWKKYENKIQPLIEALGDLADA